MLDRFQEVDQLAAQVFLVRHFCTRDLRQPLPGDLVRDVRLWMELNDFDLAPIDGSNGGLVVRREVLRTADPQAKVDGFASPTSDEHWIDDDVSLQQALHLIANRDWLLVRERGQLVGILTLGDLASPVVSVYLLARLLGMERGLRRLCGTYGHRPIADEPGTAGAGDGWSLSDAVNEAGKLEKLRADLGTASKTAYDKLTSPAVRLRNRLAHGGNVLSFAAPREGIDVISKVECLVEAVDRLVSDRDEVWKSFANTIIESATTVLAGPNADALPLPAPVHVITAHNPHENVLSDEENRRRHRLLGDYLLPHAASELVEVVGRSSEGPWAEDSWAISGLTRDEAVRIGGYFQQRAIFELTATEVRVIAVDGARFISVLRAR